jgi:hypothetical protein
MTPRAQCGACGEDFSGVRLFDRHRVGVHEYLASVERPDGRRCLAGSEMLEKGWRWDAKGRWYDPADAARLREAFSDAA